MPKRHTKKHQIFRRGRQKQRFTRKREKGKLGGGKLGGTPSDEYAQKNAFRRTLHTLVSQIANRTTTSRNKVKEAVALLVRFFHRNPLLNTLVPVSMHGKFVDKYTSKIAVADFVSPVTFMLDQLDGVSDKDMVRILNAYFANGGNFNNVSSRFKETPFTHEINKQRINNIRLLLNREFPFHIIEDGLDTVTKNKLSALMPNEQRITQPFIAQPFIAQPFVSLTLPSPIPDVGYDRNAVPAFWKPVFQDDEELLQIRESFLSIYEKDRYTNDTSKRFLICDLLETLFPAYFTKYTLGFRETPKTLVNMNVLNCFITLLYGMILYKLYDTRQDYLFIFKGGRALQLSLVDIPDIGKYFSEDTDIQIVPNPVTSSRYDADKMMNLSEHIAYLVKWMIPEEVHIMVSLSTNPKNTNKEITKLLYNDDKLFKALSDIGFGEIHEDVKQYFDHYLYSPMYVDHFETIALFITPSIYDMLAEKVFYYSLYFKLQQRIERKEPVADVAYANVSREECDHLLLKFKRAILKLVDAILKKDYFDALDHGAMDSKKLMLREIVKGYHDFTNQEKEQIVLSIYPTY